MRPLEAPLAASRPSVPAASASSFATPAATWHDDDGTVGLGLFRSASSHFLGPGGLGLEGEAGDVEQASRATVISSAGTAAGAFARALARFGFGPVDLLALKKFPVLVVLAAWHTYAIWMAAIAMLCITGNVFLSWYIDWYQKVPPSAGQLNDFPYHDFFVVFLRTWLLVQLLAEMFRFCYILTKESWVLDTFGGYRRHLLGLGGIQMQNEYDVSWPHSVLSTWRRLADRCIQFLIHFSFDVLPLAIGASSLSTRDASDISAGVIAMFETVLFVALVHVTFYFLAWTATDLYLKAHAFRSAWAEDMAARRQRRRHSSRSISRRSGVSSSSSSAAAAGASRAEAEAEAEGDASPRPPRLAERCSRCPRDFGRALLRMCSLRRRTTGTLCGLGSLPPASPVAAAAGAVPADGERVAATASWRRSSSIGSSASSAAPPAGGFEGGGGAWQLTLADAAAAGAEDEGRDKDPSRLEQQTQTDYFDPWAADLVADRLNICVAFCNCLSSIPWVLIFGIAIIVYLVSALVSAKTAFLWTVPLGVVALLLWRFEMQTDTSRMPRSKLQEWGDTTCGLDLARRGSAYRAFKAVVILQGVLFALAQQWMGFWICVGVVSAVIVREVVLPYEGNHGWWLGVLEGLVVWLAVMVMNKPGTRVMTLIFVLLHQFGLRRFNPKGVRLHQWIRGFMYFVIFAIISAVLLTAAGPPEDSNWSAFVPGRRNITIPERNTSGLGPLCELRYASGGSASGQPELSVADFAVMSSLAYERADKMEAALEHFFPGWHIVFARVANTDAQGSASKSDWTTYFEFADAGNTTSVIVVRGTDTTLDILTDINLWLPAVIMQVFELIGPWMSVAVTRAVSFWSNTLFKGEASRYVAGLANYTRRRLREDRGRRFYITGHSLGGGLAKLASFQEDIQAITFMAPGLERTGYLVLHWNASVEENPLLSRALTLMPTNDLVSRVDTQISAVIPSQCSEDPLTCHSLYPAALCPIYQQCGAMRGEGGAPVRLPCGWCGDVYAC